MARKAGNDKLSIDIRSELKRVATKGGRYFTGTARMFLDSTTETVNNAMPTVGAMLETNKDVIDATLRFLRNPVDAIHRGMDRISQDEGFKAAKKFATDAIDDLRTGNIYDPDRDRTGYGTSIDSLLDNFGDFEMSGFGEDGEYTEPDIDTEAFDHDEEMLESHEVADDQRTVATIDAIQGVGNAVVASSNVNAQTDIRLGIQQHAQIMGSMTNMVTQQGALLDAVNAMATSMLEVQRETHNDIMGGINSITDILGTIRDQGAPKQEEENRIENDSVFGSSGELNIRKWLEAARRNVDDKYGISSTIGMMTMGMTPKQMIELVADNPLKFLISDQVVNKVIPQYLKDTMETSQKYFENFFPSLLAKWADQGKRFDKDTSEGGGKFIDLLAGIFGVQPKAGGSLDLTPRNMLEKAEFTNKTATAIEKVIPMWLSKIYSGITGKEERTWNYTKGELFSVNKVIADSSHDVSDYVGRMGSSSRNFINRATNKDAFEFIDPDMEKDFENYLYRFLQKAAEDGSFLNYNMPAKDFKEMMPDDPNKDLYYRMIVATLSHMPRNEIMALNSEINKSRFNQRQTSERISKDLRESGLDVAYAMADKEFKNTLESNSVLYRHGLDNEQIQNLETERQRQLTERGLGIRATNEYLRDVTSILSRGIITYTHILDWPEIPGTRTEGSPAPNPEERFGDAYQRIKDAADTENDRISNKNRRDEQEKTDKRDRRSREIREREEKQLNRREDNGNKVFIKNGREVDDISLNLAQGSLVINRTKDGESDNKPTEEQRIMEDRQNKVRGLAEGRINRIKEAFKINDEDSFTKKVGKVLESPFKLVDLGLRTVDSFLFKIIYGEDAPDNLDDPDHPERDQKARSLMDTMTRKMKAQWASTKEWFKEYIGDPIKEFFLGEQGILGKLKSRFTDKIVDPVVNKVTDIKDAAVGKVLGNREIVTKLVDDPDHPGEKKMVTEKGDYQGGILSDRLNQVRHRIKGIGEDGKETGLSWLDTLLYNDRQGKINKGKVYMADEIDFDDEGNQIINEGHYEYRGLVGAGKEIVDNAKSTISQWLFGEDEDGNDYDSRAKFNTMKEELNKAFPDMIIGSGIGVIGSLFLPGGPFLGAILGAAGGIVSGSDKLKNYLFGEEEDDHETTKYNWKTGQIETVKGKGRKGGIIPAEMQDAFKKFAPKMAIGAGLGVVGSMFLPGGPFIGALLGSIGGMTAASDQLKQVIFGDGTTDENGREKGIIPPSMRKKIVDAVQDNFVGIGIGTVAGAKLGSMLGAGLGLIPGLSLLPGGPIFTLLGGITGAIGGNTLQEYFFGSEEEVEETDPKTGEVKKVKKRIGGLFGRAYDYVQKKVFTPFGEKMTEVGEKVKTWFGTDVVGPLRHAMQPLQEAIENTKNDIKNAFLHMTEHIKESLNNVFDKAFGLDLKQFWEEKIKKPMSNMVSKLLGGIGKAIGAVISAPFKLIDFMVTGHWGKADPETGEPIDDDPFGEKKLPFSWNRESKRTKRDWYQIFTGKKRKPKTEKPEGEKKSLLDRFITWRDKDQDEDYNKTVAEARRYYDPDEPTPDETPEVDEQESTQPKEKTDKSSGPRKGGMAETLQRLNAERAKKKKDKKPEDVKNTDQPDQDRTDEEDKKPEAEPVDQSKNKDVQKGSRRGKSANSYLKSIDKTTRKIYDEIRGQLGGVGWNIAYIKTQFDKHLGKLKADELPEDMEGSKKVRKKRGIFGRMVDKVKDLGGRAKDKVIDIKDSAVEAVKSTIGLVLKPFQLLGKAAGVATKGLLSFGGSLLKILGTLGQGIAKGLSKIFVGAGELLGRTLGGVGKIIWNAGAGIGKALGNTLSLVTKVIEGFGSAVATGISGVLRVAATVVPDMAIGVWKAFGKAAGGLFKGVKWIGGKALDAVKWGFGKITGKGKTKKSAESSATVKISEAISNGYMAMGIGVKNDLNPYPFVRYTKDRLISSLNDTAIPVWIMGSEGVLKTSGSNEPDDLDDIEAEPIERSTAPQEIPDIKPDPNPYHLSPDVRPEDIRTHEKYGFEYEVIDEDVDYFGHQMNMPKYRKIYDELETRARMREMEEEYMRLYGRVPGVGIPDWAMDQYDKMGVTVDKDSGDIISFREDNKTPTVQPGKVMEHEESSVRPTSNISLLTNINDTLSNFYSSWMSSLDRKAAKKVEAAKEVQTSGGIDVTQTVADNAAKEEKREFEEYKRGYKRYDAAAEKSQDPEQVADKAIERAQTREEAEGIVAAEGMNDSKLGRMFNSDSGKNKKDEEEGGLLDSVLSFFGLNGENGAGGIIKTVAQSILPAGLIAGASKLFGGVKMAASGLGKSIFGNLPFIAGTYSAAKNEEYDRVATNVAKQATGKGFQWLGRSASDAALAAATGSSATTVGGAVIKGFASVLSKFFSNKTVQSVIMKVSPTLYEKLAGKGSEEILKEFTKRAAMGVGSEAAQQLAKKLNMIVLIGTAVWDLTTGMANTGQYFNVREQDAGQGMRLASGLAKAISGFAFGIIPVEWLANTMYNLIASDESKAKLKESQNRMTTKVAQFNQENGTNLTVDQYKDQYNDNGTKKTFLTKAGGILGSVTDIFDAPFQLGNWLANKVGGLFGAEEKELVTPLTMLASWLNNEDAKFGFNFTDGFYRKTEEPVVGQGPGFTDVKKDLPEPKFGTGPVEQDTPLESMEDIGKGISSGILKYAEKIYRKPADVLNIFNRMGEGFGTTALGDRLNAKDKIDMKEILEDSLITAFTGENATGATTKRKGIFENLKNNVRNMWTGLQNIGSTISNKFSSVIDSWFGEGTIVNSIVTSAKNAFDNVATMLQNAWDDFWNKDKDSDFVPLVTETWTPTSTSPKVEDQDPLKDADRVVQTVKDAAERFPSKADQYNTALANYEKSKDLEALIEEVRKINTGTGRNRWGTGRVSPMDQTASVWNKKSKEMSKVGCGPTAAAMIASAYGKNANPEEANASSKMMGMRASDGGTNPDFFGKYAKSKGFGMSEGKTDPNAIANNVSSGKPVVLMGEGGAYGKNMHYMVADGMAGKDKVNIVDPIGGTRKSVDMGDLMKNTSKTVYSYGKGSGPCDDVKNTTAQPDFGKGSMVQDLAGMALGGAEMYVGNRFTDQDQFDDAADALSIGTSVGSSVIKAASTARTPFTHFGRETDIIGRSVVGGYYAAKEALGYSVANESILKNTPKLIKNLMNKLFGNPLVRTVFGRVATKLGPVITEIVNFINVHILPNALVSTAGTAMKTAAHQIATFISGGGLDIIMAVKNAISGFWNADQYFPDTEHITFSMKLTAAITRGVITLLNLIPYIGTPLSIAAEIYRGDLIHLVYKLVSKLYIDDESDSIMAAPSGMGKGPADVTDSIDVKKIPILEFGKGPSDGTDNIDQTSGTETTGDSRSSIREAQQSLVDRMYSIYKKLNYSLGNVQDPDKGVASCASTVGWAYRKALGVTGMSASSSYQSKDDRFQTIYTKTEPSGMPDLSKLQPGDILYQYPKEQYGNKTYADMVAMNPEKPLGHTEMYTGDGSHSISHGGPNWSDVGPKEKDMNDWRKKRTFLVRRYKPFLDGTEVSYNAVDPASTRGGTFGSTTSGGFSGSSNSYSDSGSYTSDHVIDSDGNVKFTLDPSGTFSFFNNLDTLFGGITSKLSNWLNNMMGVATTDSDTGSTDSSSSGTTSGGSYKGATPDPNFTPASSGSVNDSTIPGTVYNFLRKNGLTPIAAAGVLGNLEAESEIRPDNVQDGTYAKNMSYADEDKKYIQDVTSGVHDFVHDSKGWGLAQWTYHSRKQGLWDLLKEQGQPITALAPQMQYLWDELNNMNLLAPLNNAKSVKAASNIMLHDFEGPRDQSEKVENYRGGLSQKWYDKFAMNETSAQPVDTAAEMETADDTSMDNQEESGKGWGAGPGGLSLGLESLNAQIEDINRYLSEMNSARTDEESLNAVTKKITSSMEAAAGATVDNGAMAMFQAMAASMAEMVTLLTTIANNTKKDDRDPTSSDGRSSARDRARINNFPSAQPMSENGMSHPTAIGAEIINKMTANRR